MNRKRYLSAFAVLSLTFIIFMNPSKSLEYSLNGLNLWFQKMIPSLFPFMVLSGIIIRMDLTSLFVKVLKPILYPVFRVRSSCLYGIIIGFLCGFPMGANATVLLYENNQITKQEAKFLLSFCNNIGPIYFLNFVLPILSIEKYILPLFTMYGFPLLYGLFLRLTIYRKLPFQEKNITSEKVKPISLFSVLDESIWKALEGILRLGGYMIFFNLLFMIPECLMSLLSVYYFDKDLSSPVYALFCILEITGGIGFLQGSLPYLVLCLLPFGGFCCMAQTYSIIRRTDLSMTDYFMHKMVLTAITVFFYLLISFLSKTR